MPRKRSQLSRQTANAKRLRALRSNKTEDERVHRLATQRAITEQNHANESIIERSQRLVTNTSGDSVCQICSKKISEDNRPADVERVICNECFGNLNGHSSIVKLEVVPYDFKEFNTDIPKVVEEPFENDVFYCYQCGFASIDKKTLVQHVIIHNVSVKDEDLELAEFNKTSLKSDDLNNSAVQSSRHEKPYKCTICDYSTSFFRSLTAHMRTHTGEKPFNCKHCNYSTISSYKLTRHMSTHTGEKPYKCDVCEYPFARSEHLKYHKRTHTGEKPYKCTICEYSCARSHALNVHMRMHTDEKPYKCEV